MAASATTTLLKHPSTLCGGVRNALPPNTSNYPSRDHVLKFRAPNKPAMANAVSSPTMPTTITTTNNQPTTTTTPSLLLREFDPTVPAEEAFTPPSSWYTDPAFYSMELDRIFYKGWQVVGYSNQIKEANQYFTGRLGNIEYVVCRDGDGKVHAFHNVCTHRASILACGSGKKSCFVCPYHGWVFGLDGELMKATKTTEKQKFDPKELGLVPLKVAIFGPFVLVSFDRSQPEVNEANFGREWLGSSSELVKANALGTSMNFVCRHEFPMESNWKVFCDNYLDSAYHVPYAHKYYASELDFDTYSTEIIEHVVIQRVGSSSSKPDGFDRLGTEAFYAFVYPNFAVERYGPWMSTMRIHPLGHRKCKLVLDYYIDPSFKDDKEFIEKSIEINDNVQKEDVVLCESVQRGLETPAYRSGRYVIPIEKGIHHFHCWLHQTLNG